MQDGDHSLSLPSQDLSVPCDKRAWDRSTEITTVGLTGQLHSLCPESPIQGLAQAPPGCRWVPGQEPTFKDLGALYSESH